MIDWRGNFYEVGSTVLYPRASGRSVEITEGTVLEIVEVPDSWVFIPETTTWGRGVGYKVKVQPHGRGSRRFYRGDDLKPVWILKSENVTAV